MKPRQPGQTVWGCIDRVNEDSRERRFAKTGIPKQVVASNNLEMISSEVPYQFTSCLRGESKVFDCFSTYADALN